jgi:NAD(P) transhydrogenase
VNENFQTAAPHIYAVGDVIGFPALASTAMEQGRLASLHMFEEGYTPKPFRFPYGIYTIPEISVIGKSEQVCHTSLSPLSNFIPSLSLICFRLYQ